MKKYRVIRDLQGGGFGMGRDYTVEEWIEQAIDWHDSDEYFEDDKAVERFREELLKGAKERGDWYVLGYIADHWQLEFEEVPQEVM